MFAKYAVKKHETHREPPFFIKLCSGPIKVGIKTKQKPKQKNPKPTKQQNEVKVWLLVSMLIPESTSSPRLALIRVSVRALGTEGESWGLASVCTGSSLPSSVALQFKDAKFID